MCSLVPRHLHLPPLLHGTDAGIGSRGGAWYGAIRATPSLPTQTGPAPTREDATGTSGRESRGSAGSPRRRRAASRARAARAAAARCGRLAGRRVGGRAGGRRAHVARVELSSILGGLTARTLGTPAHLRQSFHLPPPASWLEGVAPHVGWYRCPARLGYSGCYLGSSRSGGAVPQAASSTKVYLPPPTIPVIITCAHASGRKMSTAPAGRTQGAGHTRPASASAYWSSQRGFDSRRGTHNELTNHQV
jgi:hypothetical protein